MAGNKGKGPKTVRPVKGVNFESKRDRKAVRKGLIRAAVSNKVADARADAKARMEFYRNLRELKMKRRMIAQELSTLAVLVIGLVRDVQHAEDRYVEIDLGLCDEARALSKKAAAAVVVAADEFFVFSRKKVFYTEMVVAA